MEFAGNGELIPVGGGDVIPLPRSPLVLGRRESCDICLNFPNVSGRHCEFVFKDGFWILHDLNSTNGVKVNGEKVAEGGKKVLRPQDTITIGKRQYTIQYNPTDRFSKIEELEEEEEDILGVPLLERAGLEKPHDRRKPKPPTSPGWDSDDDDDDDD